MAKRVQKGPSPPTFFHIHTIGNLHLAKRPDDGILANNDFLCDSLKMVRFFSVSKLASAGIGFALPQQLPQPQDRATRRQRAVLALGRLYDR